MAASLRAFILRNTVLRPVPGLDGIRLHLADEALPLWRAVQVETGDDETPLPYWAFAWGGGLALSHYLQAHPEAVAGRRVFDLASGSGLCAIAAMRSGAAEAVAADIDPFAIAAIAINARANQCRVATIRRDVFDDPPPDADLIVAGDCWYEARLAERVLPWLRDAQERGIEVLLGDPGRRYLPIAELEELATYQVRTTTDLEDLALKQGRVYALGPLSGTGGLLGRDRRDLGQEIAEEDRSAHDRRQERDDRHREDPARRRPRPSPVRLDDDG